MSSTDPTGSSRVFCPTEATELMDSSHVTPDQQFLIGYVDYKRKHQDFSRVSFVQYMHSTVCVDFPCYCQVYFALASHFDDCHCWECNLCRPARRSCVTVQHPQGSRKQERRHPTEEILPLAKRLKMGNPSLPGIGVSDAAASLKTRPLGHEQLSHVQQCPEASASYFTSKVAVPTPIWRSTSIVSSRCTDGTETALMSELKRATRIRHIELIDGSNEPKTIPPPSKCLKIGNTSFSEIGVSDVAGSSKIQPRGRERLPCLQEWPEASPSKYEYHVAASTPTPGSTSTGSSRSDGIEVELISELKSTTPTRIEQQKTVTEESTRNLREIVSDFMQLLDNDSVNMFRYDREEEEREVITMSDQAKVETKSDLIAGAADSEMKLEGPKLAGVSLVDFFTLEETKEHLFSLRQSIGQAVDRNTLTHNVADNSCQLCGMNKLVYQTPTFCSFCNKQIKHGLNIYCEVDEMGTGHCFCTSCFMGFRGGTISFEGNSIPKAKLQKKKNDHEDDEPWVQCDKCRLWQHQVCALYNPKRDVGGKAVYCCPKCHSEGIENGEHVPLPKTAGFGAKDFPTSLLSDYIEKRLFRRLKQDREERAKASQKKIDEEPGAEDLVVRVVSSSNKLLKVNQQFSDICGHENYPTEFPYRSKVLLLFQKIEGVDVCLFAMYVQEFGSECGHPNQHCVYISYLDSVKYFRPEIKAASGEPLRTFVYHEILLGYLDYCKKRGFATCYIWSCPPSNKFNDYILCGHPETQKTPKPDKLLQWYLIFPATYSDYKSLLKKATLEDIVVDHTDIYEHLFNGPRECNVKRTAARMPYFDGDYWSDTALESLGSDKVKKDPSKKTFLAMGYSEISADATKDVQLMDELEQTMIHVKQNFLVVHLQFACMRCREVILSGVRWFCLRCKNFQLCARCHDAEQDRREGNTHTTSTGKKHCLSQSQVSSRIPLSTEDVDAILEDGCFFEDRMVFLKFCRENYYVFDTLRRAKHSSMMMLYHLQTRNSKEKMEVDK